MIKIRNCFWSEKSAYSYPNLFFFFFFRVFPHTFFDYFFQHSNLYKERSHLIIQHTFHPLERKISFFYVLRGICFWLSNHTYFLILSLTVATKLGFLGFKENWTNFFEPTSSQEQSVLMQEVVSFSPLLWCDDAYYISFFFKYLWIVNCPFV